MADQSGPRSARCGQRPPLDGRSRRWFNDGRLSRAERLEMIFCVAAAGTSECSAWIIPILERSDVNDPTTEKWKC